MSIYFDSTNVTIRIKKRCCFVMVAVLLVVYWSLYVRNQDRSEDIREPDQLDAFRVPKVDRLRNIFFVESSCVANRSRADKRMRLTARQACAVESAARSNAHAEVYILHTCRVDARRLVDAGGHVRELFSYPNVFAHQVDLVEFLEGTPLGGWDVVATLDESKYPVEHGSDILRLVALWKYGGVYLDLDVVVLKSLSELGTNFAGLETDELVANGVMSFDPSHPLVEECMKAMESEFDPEDFSLNGPQLVSRTLMKYCQAKEYNELTPENCKGFTVYRPAYFYPIEYEDYLRYFDTKEDVPLEVAKIESYSYIAHVWNHVSKTELLDTSDEHIYGALAAKYCPLVYKQAGPSF